MKNSLKQAITRTLGLGAIAGLRATIAPAVASHYLSSHPDSDLMGTKLNFIQKPVTAIVTKVLSAAEIGGDKLPNAPDRIGLPQLLVRVTSGALVGATIFKANKESIWQGIVLGGASALAATYASFYARQYVDTLPHVKDRVVGAVEDALAVGSGIALMKKFV